MNALGSPQNISRMPRKLSTRSIYVTRIARLPRTYPPEPRIATAASGRVLSLVLSLLSAPFGHHGERRRAPSPSPETSQSRIQS